MSVRWTAGLTGTLVGLALAVAAAAAPATAATSPDPAARLIPFGSCEELIAYAREHTPKPQPIPEGVPMPTFAPAPPAAPQADSGAGRGAEEPDFSHTNVQEAGVDEPDIVKTDGRRIFAIAQDHLYEVDARAAAPRVTASVALAGSGSHQLLLWEGRGFVVSEVWGQGPAVARAALSPAMPPAETVLTELDLSQPGRIQIVRTLRIDGAYRDARLTDGVVRLVTSSTPEALADPDVQAEIHGWIPSYKVANRRTGRTATRPVADCTDVRRPPEHSGLSLLTVLTIDLSKGIAPVDSEALLSDVGTVYASPEALYVSTYPQATDDAAAGTTTRIHKFSATGRAVTRYRATGSVAGSLLNQWSLSEHGGVLRVASTQHATWSQTGQPATQSESFVTTLEERDGTLAELGRVGGLGRDERIYAVRFIGDVGYVVTFRQVDPLYTIDLADPRRPTVLGELKIPGYSAYLHPVGEDLLLGVGQDATEQGRRLGGQISLFDIADLRRPRRLATYRLPGWSSEVEWDHHAFLYWPRTRLAVVPADGYGADGTRSGATGVRITRAEGLRAVGEVRHPQRDQYGDSVRRSLVIGPRLFTLSQDGMMSSSLESLAGERWLPFE